MEVDSRLIVAAPVTDAPNDKQQLVPTVQAIAPVVGSVETVLADSGFYSEEAVRQLEQDVQGQPTGVTVYAAIDKRGHHRTATKAGRAKYKLRQQTVEPVFGIIKSAMGFRRFLMRGLEKVRMEWQLVSVAYNLKRLHTLGAGLRLAAG